MAPSGRWSKARPYPVTREGIAAFADATSDPVAKCREGQVAPPVYAINPVLAAMVAAKNLAYPGFGFHGQQDFVFHRTLEPGMVLVPIAELIGVHQRSSGVAISVHIRSLVDGETVNEQHFVSFVPKGRIERDAGRPAPELATVPDAAPDEMATSALQPDQTSRYAVAANDHDAYTTDEAVARRMGFPGLVVHGPLTVSLACGAIVTRICGGDPARLRRLAVRLSRRFISPAARPSPRECGGLAATDGASPSPRRAGRATRCFRTGWRSFIHERDCAPCGRWPGLERHERADGH